jgi:DedD protein
VGAILGQPKIRNGVMAERKEPEDDFNPRHRIVGAVVLVALAIIFLPMLLSERPPETGGSSAVPGGPAPDTRIVVTPVLPAGDKASSSAKPIVSETLPEKTGNAAKTVVVPVEPATEMAPLVKAPAVPDVPQTEAKPAPQPKPVSETRTATTPAKPVTSVEKGWLVQVGAFSQLDNAKRLHEKLRQKGYAALLDPPNPEKGKTVRVEVGPYKDAASAKAAQASIQSELGIKGVIRKQ